MKEKCLALFKNNGNCVLVGKANGKEIIYQGEDPMQILEDLNWDGLINDTYFNYIQETAKYHMSKPSAYEKSMWKLVNGSKKIEENENSLWLFSCWVEDKLKGEQIVSILRRFAKLDKFYFKFDCKKENGNKSIILEGGNKKCLIV